MQSYIDELKKIGKEITILKHIGALLNWDQETYMPSKAAEERGNQLAFIESLAHKKLLESRKILDNAGWNKQAKDLTFSNEVNTLDQVFIREFVKSYQKATKLPVEFVETWAKETSKAQIVWVKARKNNDFSMFAPNLEKLLDLSKQKINYYGYDEQPYDVLLDDFEPETKTSEIKQVFDGLLDNLSNLLNKIKQQPQIDDSFLHLRYDPEKQRQFGEIILKDMGFDFEKGRLDISAHPFTTTTGPNDVRITTRYNENFFNTALWGTIHEGGHALYEMGFNENLKGNILGDGTSLGIHESQSRTWENIIGRGKSFWKYYYPKLQEYFPENLKQVSFDNFYRAINIVKPSFIRVEADEVTYGLHIILRFNLELAMFNGNLSVNDLPSAWNTSMEKYLGIRPDSDANGVLQDVHWSLGIFGYFPTYALGNLYGAQFYEALSKDISDVEENIAQGNFQPILNWLRQNIHQYGASETAGELCIKATGKPLSYKPFMDYLNNKYSKIYGF